jgi:hypothetical protein
MSGEDKLILIDLAAYAHDTNAQMEEALTMNSFYHPREHDQEDHVPSAWDDSSAHAEGQEGHEAHAGHGEHPGYQTGHSAQGPDAEATAQSPGYSDRDLSVYQVLLAVERGELSPEDAARKLEELEASGDMEGGSGLI